MEKSIITLAGHDYKSKNTLVLVNPKKIQYKLVTPFSNILRCGSDSEDLYQLDRPLRWPNDEAWI